LAKFKQNCAGTANSITTNWTFLVNLNWSASVSSLSCLFLPFSFIVRYPPVITFRFCGTTFSEHHPTENRVKSQTYHRFGKETLMFFFYVVPLFTCIHWKWDGVQEKGGRNVREVGKERALNSDYWIDWRNNDVFIKVSLFWRIFTGGHWWSSRGHWWLLVVIRDHLWSLLDKIDEKSKKKTENACFAAFFGKVLFCWNLNKYPGIRCTRLKLKLTNHSSVRGANWVFLLHKEKGPWERGCRLFSRASCLCSFTSNVTPVILV